MAVCTIKLSVVRSRHRRQLMIAVWPARDGDALLLVSTRVALWLRRVPSVFLSAASSISPSSQGSPAFHRSVPLHTLSFVSF